MRSLPFPRKWEPVLCSSKRFGRLKASFRYNMGSLPVPAGNFCAGRPQSLGDLNLNRRCRWRPFLKLRTRLAPDPSSAGKFSFQGDDRVSTATTTATRFGNYINGEWVTSQSTFEVRNPANIDEVVGVFSKARAADVDRAADAAQAALPGWAGMSAPARGNILYKAADLLEQRFDQVSEDMTREEGKTLPEAKGEVR